jgi:hypothetical protein
MRWPEPGLCPKVALVDIPAGSPVLGLAPIGVRWTGVMTAKGIKPDPGCPAHQFLPCFADINGVVKEITCPAT